MRAHTEQCTTTLSQSQPVLDNILEILRVRASIKHPIRRFFTQPSKEPMEWVTRCGGSLDVELLRLREMCEVWLESIKQVVEVVDAAWDLEGYDMEVFTPGSFYKDEKAMVERYWRLNEGDKPWFSI